MCDHGMLESSPSVARRGQKSTWVAAGWHRRGLSGHMRIVTKTSSISTLWLKDLFTHQPSATVDSLDGDHIEPGESRPDKSAEALRPMM